MRRSVVIGLTVIALLGCQRIPHAAGGIKPPPRSVQARTDLWGKLGAERAARHLAPLKWNGRLSDRAASWSKHLSTVHKLVHSNIGELLGPYDYIGENLATGPTSAGSLHSALMHSQDHRDNMLSPGFQQAGIGVYCAGKTMWITVEFARPSSAGLPPPYAGDTPLQPIARPNPDKTTC